MSDADKIKLLLLTAKTDVEVYGTTMCFVTDETGKKYWMVPDHVMEVIRAD